MNCRAASELIMKYLDGEIKREEEAILNEHIKECQDCRLEYETLKDACSALQDIGFEDAPKDLEIKVIARIKQEDKLTAKDRGRQIFAAATLIIMAGWWVLAYLYLYTPTLNIITDRLSGLIVIADVLFDITGRFCAAAISGAVRLMALGKALAIIQQALMDTYTTLIMAMVISMALILRFSSYMFKIIRR